MKNITFHIAMRGGCVSLLMARFPEVCDGGAMQLSFGLGGVWLWAQIDL